MSESEAKKPRTHKPRALTHQALLDVVHEYCKLPTADRRDAVLKAMLEHKRYTWGDSSITVL